jgi:hypothetical protein
VLTVGAVADKPIYLRGCPAERSIGEFLPRQQERLSPCWCWNFKHTMRGGSVCPHPKSARSSPRFRIG